MLSGHEMAFAASTDPEIPREEDEDFVESSDGEYSPGADNANSRVSENNH